MKISKIQFLKDEMKKMLKLSPGIKRALAGIKRKKLELYPQVVQVETTITCNADCIMCPHRSVKRQSPHMDFELYKKIVDDCAQHRRFIKSFLPFLNGELFLTPKWENYLIYAKEKLPDIETGVYTNGSLMDKDVIDKLLKIGVDWVNISFDGVSKEAFEGIRRKISFEKVQNNIIELVNSRKRSKKKKPQISISIIEMQDTLRGLASFRKKWKGVVDDVFITPYSNWAGRVEDRGKKSRITAKHKVCSRLWHNLTILTTGEAVICCLDYDGELIIGNAGKEPIKEIWNSAKMAELRNFHLEDKYSNIHLCRDCSYVKGQPEKFIWWS